MLGDVLADVLADGLGVRFYRQQLSAAEAVQRGSAPPEGPFRPQRRRSRAVVTPLEGVEVAAGADVHRQGHQQVVMDAARLLPLDDSHRVPVPGFQNMAGQRVHSPLSFPRVQHMIPESQGQEPHALDAVTVAQRLDVQGKSQRGPLGRRRENDPRRAGSRSGFGAVVTIWTRKAGSRRGGGRRLRRRSALRGRLTATQVPVSSG